jgi:hypothetical protein
MVVRVTFDVNVEWCDEDLGPPAKGDPLVDMIEGCVSDAVREALDRTADTGFNHDMSSVISLFPGEVHAKLL